MKKTTNLLFIASFHIAIIKAQNSNGDTIAYFHNGEISYGWKNFPKHKIFEGKTMLLQEKVDGDSISRQFIRYNDSLFLYTELYQYPDSSQINQRRTWGIKREGLIEISNQTTGGTIVTFDPETYEEHAHMDTLLLPTGKWGFYYPDGRKEREGKYFNYKRHGEWMFYDIFEEPDKRIVYNNGAVEKTEFINRVHEKSIETTRTAIQNTWIIYDREANGSYKPNPKFDSYRFMYKTEGISGIGDIYAFGPGGILKYTKTKVIETEYKNGDKGLSIIQKYDVVKKTTGNWNLPNHHQIEIVLENKKELFEIEYLSESRLRLKKNE